MTEGDICMMLQFIQCFSTFDPKAASATKLTYIVTSQIMLNMESLVVFSILLPFCWLIAFPVICVLRRQTFSRILKVHFNEKDPNPV